jgi:hypothetical protein
LANGSAGSGYIYSDQAYSHLTFQVMGSRLKPVEGRALFIRLAAIEHGRFGLPPVGIHPSGDEAECNVRRIEPVV